MLKSLFFTALFVALAITTFAQLQYSPASIHSHNDYSRPNPFYQAFNAGAGAIEADVYLRNGKLLVAHDTAGLSPGRSLQKMYLQPIIKTMRTNPRAFNLVIDLKGDYAPILAELLQELKPLQHLIKNHNQNPLSIIITGNRPPPILYKNYPAFITFDDDLQRPHTTQQWKRVAQVSLKFENYSKWQGDGMLPPTDEKVLRSVINAVHASGKKIRFWAAPDNMAGWQKLMELQADILCTDKVDALAAAIK